MINDDRSLLVRTRLIAHIERIPRGDSFKATKKGIEKFLLDQISILNPKFIFFSMSNVHAWFDCHRWSFFTFGCKSCSRHGQSDACSTYRNEVWLFRSFYTLFHQCSSTSCSSWKGTKKIENLAHYLFDFLSTEFLTIFLSIFRTNITF